MLILKLYRKHVTREEPLFPEKGGKGGGADKAAKYQAEAQKQAIDLQRDMWNQTMQNLSPYMQVGQPALQSLQYLSSAGGKADFLQNYMNSQEGRDASQAARNQQLAAAEATGGLGSSATNNALASIMPALAQNAYGQQLGNMQNLMQTGMAAATGQANLGQGYANNMSSLQQGLGAIRAGGAMQPSGFQQAISGGLSGAAGGAALGSLIPGLGTGIGAAVGGGLGLLGSLF